MVSQERASRRNNLVITGLKIEGDNFKDVVEKFLIDEFQLPNALRAARNLGSMVLATMDSWDTALDILMRKKEYSETEGYSSAKIYQERIDISPLNSELRPETRFLSLFLFWLLVLGRG